MMKKKWKVLLLLLSQIYPVYIIQAQHQEAKVNLPQSLTSGKEKLVLNGSGVREKYFIDLYVCGLYLLRKNSDAKTVIDANEAMAIKLHIVSDIITGDRMAEGLQEGFEKSTGNKTAPLQDRINQFTSVFKDPIVTGDVYDLVYTPASGLVIYKNNVKKAQVPGLDFKKALFGLWLGTDPADGSLKRSMLGK